MYALDFFGYALFVSAPPGIHPVGAAMKNGFYPADVAIFYFEQFRKLPGPVYLYMIEKTEVSSVLQLFL